MLPTYASSEREKEKLQQKYSSANGSSYPNGAASGTFHIAPHRFQPRAIPLYRRKKGLITRLAIGLCLFFTLLFGFFPSTKPNFLPSLNIFDSEPDFDLETVRYYDLSKSQGTAEGWRREERVLLCAPLRDAASHLDLFFGHLRNLTYPHHLIDLAFLVGDSKDDTLSLLSTHLHKLQAHENPKIRYGEISIIEKDFGQTVNQDVESRHGFAAQASRRKSMAQARNWLLSAALRPSHSWVYWRDVDVETAPFTILEDLMRHNRDVIVPNVWRPLPDWLGGEQPYDLNSWQESETALALADTLDEDAVIVEGYAEYATWRPHLAYLRDPFGDPDMEMEVDGVGGVSILSKAKVFRSGVHFPAFSFEKHAETEGFGKMAKRMQYSVIGLPHYTIWHLYEPSYEDIRHMEEIESSRKAKAAVEQSNREEANKLKEQSNQPKDKWDADKQAKDEQKYEEIRRQKEREVEEYGVEHIYGEDGKARLNKPFKGPKVDPGRYVPPVAGDEPPRLRWDQDKEAVPQKEAAAPAAPAAAITANLGTNGAPQMVEQANPNPPAAQL